MSKKLSLVSIFLLATSYFLPATPANAIERPHFVTFTNPVRGPERGYSPVQTHLDLPMYQYQLAKENNFPVDWLLRFDALKDATISAYFKTITATDSSQMVGAFLEVTPLMATAAGVEYPAGEPWSLANLIFLSGYSQADRLRLIDTYMNLFYEKFDSYPQVVGAWHLDAFSLEYLSSRYSVITAIVCDEQYNTDSYRFWGGYLGSPYFSSKNNFLVPATTRDNRINIALTKWAQRDPFNFYGIRNESNFSTQVNDYTSQGLKTDYFSDLTGIYSNSGFNEFTQTNIGLENDYSLAQFKAEIKASYQSLRANQEKDNLVFISSKDFGQWLATRYSFTNPAYFYSTSDITGRQEGTVYWYQNPFYRIGLKSSGGQTQILDFRLYNQSEAEEHFLVKNTNKMLYAEINPLVDSIKYPGSALSLDIDLEKAQIDYRNWKVTFTQEEKRVSLQPEKIVFSNLVPPTINTQELKITTSNNQTIWRPAPSLPFTGKPWVLVSVLVFSLLLCVLIVSRQKNTKNKLLLITGWLFGSATIITVFRSGLVYRFGLGFWGPNGHDAIFHLSLSEHFKSNLFNLGHPQLAGQVLKNYHFGFDWISALFSRLSQFSLLNVYFRVVPILLVIAIVLVTVKLLIYWRYSVGSIFLSLFLIFLAGSAGFIPAALSGRSLFSGESVFWANQSVSLLLNPPFALSILVLLTFLLFIETHPHRLTHREWLFLSLLGGVLVQIKIYAFVLLFFSLLLRKKIKLAFGVGIFGVLFILPSLGGIGSFPFVLQPLWFARSMFESHDRLYWQQLAQAWQVYENNGVLFKLVLVNIFAVVIFYLGNLWLRVIGLWRVIIGNEPTVSGRLTQTIVLLGLVVPLIFTQKVNPWNTIQFMYYSLFFLGIFTAGQVGDWLSKTRNHLLSAVCYMLIVLLFLPTTIGTLKDYLTRQSASRVSLTELRALDLIRQSPPGVVVSPLTYGNLPSVSDPKPLYAYTSTAYISALTGHPEYLGDTINLDITGFSYSDPVKNVIRLYQTRDPLWVKKFLSENNIVYVYETPFDKVRVRSEDACLIKIFDSGEINLYKYSCQ